MPRFPRTEPEIARLALQIIDGLEQSAEDFPSPPVPAAEMRDMLEAYNTATLAATVAETEFGRQHAVKDEALENLVDSMKANLKYGEIAVRDRPDKLKALGWGPRRDGSPLEAPGQVRNEKVVAEGDTWIALEWKPPVEGGPVGVYRIQRKQDGGPWEEVGMSTETQHMLGNQPRGVEFSYRVYAVNKAGTGQPSGMVTAVL
jgi:hypothetical protein